MARPKAKAPSLRYHLSGQSVVTVDGRDFYLGKHDSPESIARYAVLIGIYQMGGLTLPERFDLSSLDDRVAVLASLSPVTAATHQAAKPITVRHITAAYREHVKTRYAENKIETDRMRGVCDDIDKHDGDIVATEYGPLRLQAQRQRWVDSGKSRVYCNRLTNSVKRIWKYAVSQELVDTLVAVGQARQLDDGRYAVQRAA